jgi:hypothetical protein
MHRSWSRDNEEMSLYSISKPKPSVELTVRVVFGQHTRSQVSSVNVVSVVGCLEVKLTRRRQSKERIKRTAEQRCFEK